MWRVSRSATLTWDREPFAGLIVESATSFAAADGSAQYDVTLELGSAGCLTVAAWDLWQLEPAPARMLGQIEIVEPTTATLVTTIVIESSICP